MTTALLPNATVNFRKSPALFIACCACARQGYWFASGFPCLLPATGPLGPITGLPCSYERGDPLIGMPRTPLIMKASAMTTAFCTPLILLNLNFMAEAPKHWPVPVAVYALVCVWFLSTWLWLPLGLLGRTLLQNMAGSPLTLSVFPCMRPLPAQF